MRHVPALDGLRGLAVLAVLGYHHGLDWIGGGFLGVSLFFTLSGFLITSLLVGEYRTTGRLDLRNFWSRRVRRLAPVAVLGIVLALAVTVVVVPQAQQVSAFTDIRAALAQLSNWRFVFAETPYANVGTTPSPVLHYWSLAIEEQFYLALPLVSLLALRRGRRALALALGVAVAASVALQVGLPPTERVYFGTDTRAAELALGALLALGWWALPRRSRRGVAWDVVGVVALALTGVLWIVAEPTHPLLLGGGLAGVGMVSTGVLVGALGGRWLPRGLEASPLQYVGRISYGVYVVHFPLFLALTPERIGVEGEFLLAVRVAASLGLAALSYRWLERPVRLGQPILGRPLRGVSFGVPVLACLVLLAAVSVPLQRTVPLQGPTPTGLLPQGAGGEGSSENVTDTGPSPAPVAQQGPKPDTHVDGDADAGVFPPVPPDHASPATDASEESVATRPPRVVVVGDSTAEAIGAGLRSWGAQTGRLEVSAVFSPGCAVLEGVTARYREGFEFTPDGCDRLFPTAVLEVDEIDADALVVFIGSPQLADWRYPDREGWHDITQPEIGEAYRQQLDEVLDDLATTEVPVLWADTPVPDWDVDQFGAMLGGQLPGSGEPVINEPERTEALNRHTLAGLDGQVGAVTVPYADGLAGPDGEIESDDRIDGLHLSEEQVVEAAETWLMSALDDAYQEALAERGERPPVEFDWARGAATPTP